MIPSTASSHDAVVAGDPRIPASLDALPPDVSVPDDARCVFVSGSLVAGWGHTTSDIDLYVVTDEAVEVEATATIDLGVAAAAVPVVILIDPRGYRYDVEYWTTAHVEALLSAVAWRDESTLSAGFDLTRAAVDCFHRISIGRALAGHGWLAAVQERLAASALPRILAQREFTEADAFLDDALGLLDVGDHESAVLAARQALGHAVDGYLAANGSYAPSVKWRYRKLVGHPGSVLGPKEYWQLESMRDFDSDEPRRWIDRIRQVCGSLVLEVDFDQR